MSLHRHRVDRKVCSEEVDLIHSAVVGLGPSLSHMKPGVQPDVMVMAVGAAGVDGKPR